MLLADLDLHNDGKTFPKFGLYCALLVVTGPGARLWKYAAKPGHVHLKEPYYHVHANRTGWKLGLIIPVRTNTTDLQRTLVLDVDRKRNLCLPCAA